MKEDHLNKILEAFLEETGFKIKWKSLGDNNRNAIAIDGSIQLLRQANKLIMPVTVKTSIRYHHLHDLQNLFRQNKELLVIAEDILPKIKKEFKDSGINYIDEAGNAFINTSQIFVLLEGKKQQHLPPADLKSKAFSKAGLKVIFEFFLDDSLINDTMREIAEVADVSLDSVHKTINSLKQLHYLINVNNRIVQWNDKKALLERWMTEYDLRLKPSLHMGNFRFLKEDYFLDWKKMYFKDGVTRWGGEPAGELFTDYLKPEILTLYTSESKPDLIKKYRIIPDPNGYIRVYKKFWKKEGVSDNVVEPLLVYADLVNTGDRRNIETAQKIYEKFLQDKF